MQFPFMSSCDLSPYIVLSMYGGLWCGEQVCYAFFTLLASLLVSLISTEVLAVTHEAQAQVQTDGPWVARSVAMSRNFTEHECIL